MNLTQYTLPHIERLQPYIPGTQPASGLTVARLHQNEHPYPPSPFVLQALQDSGSELIRCYPHSQGGELREALTAHYGVSAEQVLCGNGSSELIQLIYRAFIGLGGKAVIPYPTFALYDNAAAAWQSEVVRVAARPDFTIDTEELAAAACDARAIFLVNPGAPTGLLLSAEQVERLARSTSALVIIDEAYMDFADSDQSVIRLIHELPNLLVLRTFSKAYALAGARVGCVFGGRALIRGLEKIKGVYPLNALSQRLAIAALADQPHMRRGAEAIRQTRASFSLALQAAGWAVLPSQGNFVLCTPPAQAGNAATLAERLEQNGIYVRHFRAERLEDKLRISIGTAEQMEQMLVVTSRLLA